MLQGFSVDASGVLQKAHYDLDYRVSLAFHARANEMTKCGGRIMTWLVADDWDSTPMGELFQALVDRPGIVRAPGAHNAMAGVLAKNAGFDCLYVSCAAVTASMALPDLGVITLDDLCFQLLQKPLKIINMLFFKTEKQYLNLLLQEWRMFLKKY